MLRSMKPLELPASEVEVVDTPKAARRTTWIRRWRRSAQVGAGHVPEAHGGRRMQVCGRRLTGLVCSILPLLVKWEMDLATVSGDGVSRSKRRCSSWRSIY